MVRISEPKGLALMYHNTSIIYDLCLDLKEHGYINHNSEEILTESQNHRICQYLDDLAIDLFFRLTRFKPIIVTPEICFERFTPNGIIQLDKPVELDLNSPYDRYTFIEVLTTPRFLERKFPKNKFANTCFLGYNTFGSYSVSHVIHPEILYNPYLDPFYDEYRLMDFEKNKASSLYCFRDFITSYQNELRYGFHCPMYLAEILSDYASIKNEEIFPGVSLDYALSIYVILVEKLQIEYNSISSIASFGLDKKPETTHPLQLFHNFELRLPKLFKADEIDMRDVYLRFINRETTKAFTFDYDHDMSLVTIQLFNGNAVKSVARYNTLPLPFLYNKLYN